MTSLTRDRSEVVPPGPKGHPCLGILPEYSRNPLGFFTRCAQEFGDVVYLKGPFFPSYFFNHPDWVEQVLVTQNAAMRRSPLFDIARPMIGNGLLTSDGEFWRRQRHLMQPAFHRERIATYGNIMVNCTQELLHTWELGQRDLLREMMRLTLTIVAQSFFGADIADEIEVIEQVMTAGQEQFDRRSRNAILYLLPDTVPLPGNLRFHGAVRQLDRLIYRLIQERRQSGDDRGDLLSMLLNARDEDGQGMTDRQVRDEIATMMMAGHETTAVALTWTWYLLATHPDVEAALINELQGVLGNRSPTPADLPKLRYAEWIVREAMRLYPPVWATGRMVAKPCQIAGYTLPKGSSIVVSQYVMQRDPRWFSNPEAFQPGRWANDLAKRLPTYAYFPFGGGPRVCIGRAFAMMEAVLILATIAQQFRVSLIPNQTIESWPAVSLRPRYGLQVQLEQR